MKTVLTLSALATALGFGAIPTMESRRSDERPRVAGLHFLAGAWSGKMWGGTFTSYYSTPEGGKVLSYSELEKDGTVGFHEFEKFDLQDGRVTFTPFPRGQRATPLRLSSLEGNKATFENPDKDFPTRIVYHRIAADQLVITLSDPHRDSDRVQVFDLKRVGD